MPSLEDATHDAPCLDGDGPDEGAELGCGLADAAGPDCTDHWTGTDLAGQFGAAIDTWVSWPRRQAGVDGHAWPDAPPRAYQVQCSGRRYPPGTLFVAAYPPWRAAIRHSTAASERAS